MEITLAQLGLNDGAHYEQLPAVVRDVLTKLSEPEVEDISMSIYMACKGHRDSLGKAEFNTWASAKAVDIKAGLREVPVASVKLGMVEDLSEELYTAMGYMLVSERVLSVPVALGCAEGLSTWGATSSWLPLRAQGGDEGGCHEFHVQF